MDLSVHDFVFDVLILQFCIHNVNVVCAFCLASWFLHGFHLFYLHDLLHSHKVFSYVCLILRHGGSWARKLRRQFFNKRSSCHKNPVVMKKTAMLPFPETWRHCLLVAILFMSDKLKHIVVIFYTSILFFCQEFRKYFIYLSIYLLIYRFLILPAFKTQVSEYKVSPLPPPLPARLPPPPGLPMPHREFQTNR